LFLTYSYNSGSTTYYKFSNIGSFGKKSSKRDLEILFLFEPEEFGLFYSDFHKKLTISKVFGNTVSDYNGINDYEITGEIRKASQFVSILLYLWIIICISVLCPAKFTND